MNAYQRVSAQRSLKVSASADAFFKQLMRWDEIVGWPDPPVRLTRVDLAPGHRVGTLPCTRRCYIDHSQLPAGVPPGAVPQYVAETLLMFDFEARTCLYVLEGQGPGGMRNYFASTQVDEIDPGSCLVTCIGRCDLPAEESAEIIQGMLVSTYERGVIGGTASLIGASVVGWAEHPWPGHAASGPSG
jgi:hypothetical protein